MKKATVLLVLMFLCLGAQAQVGHMKFMGIPMGISISSFQSKLANKGVKYDPISKRLEQPVRVYKGIFAGYEAKIFVYYDSKTKLVYRAKAKIEEYSKESMDNVYYNMLDMLCKKYGADNIVVNSEEDEECHSITVYTDEGSIDLFEFYNKFGYELGTGGYEVYVDYYDAATVEKDQRNRMEDL